VNRIIDYSILFNRNFCAELSNTVTTSQVKEDARGIFGRLTWPGRLPVNYSSNYYSCFQHLGQTFQGPVSQVAIDLTYANILFTVMK
jgi:hypothetical protein